MALSTRAVAANALTLVAGEGKALDAVLSQALDLLEDPRDRAFTQELVYGVLRWYWKLLPQLQSLLRRPLRRRDRDVEMLLLAGLYQLQYLSTPPHAAVAATVEACVEFDKAWAKKLVNGTLRNAIRGAATLDELAMSSVSTRTAHVEWFVRTLQSDWPAHWETILAADNEYPPCTLRVNALQGSRDEYLETLALAGIQARPTKYSVQGIRLDKPIPVESLPEFEQGRVSIQDEAAQLAATVLDLTDCARVLDACAAPGGKTAHVLESNPGHLSVVAVDRSAHRVALLSDTLRRLRLSAITHTARPEDWWDGTQFDRILVDAPCSGSGVIRRHPDIKIHRRENDIRKLVDQQIALLDSLWLLLKPGGKLIYGTCSVLRAENDRVISRFVAGGKGIRMDRIKAAWGVATDCGRQIITGEQYMDGFYYARLVKE
jgi:16S rRNA (cytosine967-C5)-methyltransferase